METENTSSKHGLKKNQPYIWLGVIVIVLVLVGIFTKKDSNPSDANKDASAVLDTEKKDDTNVPTIEPVPIEPASTSKSGDQYMNKALSDISNKDYEAAQKDITAALSANNQNADYWYVDATVKVLRSDLAGGFASMKKSTAFAPTNTTYWKWMIEIARRVLGRQGMTTTAPVYRATLEPLYQDALIKTHEDIEIVMPYAIFLEDVGDKQKAIEYWQKAIVIAPTAKSSFQANIDRLSK